MVVETVTLKLPKNLYRRLVSHADATRRPLEDVILHALTVGSPLFGRMFRQSIRRHWPRWIAWTMKLYGGS